MILKPAFRSEQARWGLAALADIAGIPCDARAEGAGAVEVGDGDAELPALAALAWDCLTGAKEAGLPADRYGNPLANGHPLGKAGLLLDPPVDRAARRLGEFWDLEVGAPRAPAWPGGAPYALALSHDVDDPLKGQLVYGALLAASGLLKGVPRARRDGLSRMRAWWRVRRGGPDPYFTFRAIRELERAEGVRSTFFAMPILDGDWEVRVSALDQPLLGALREAAAEGWEVGVHGSNASAVDGSRLARERLLLEEALGRRVDLLRHHNLRWRGAAAWGRIRAAGFAADSSVGFNEAPGFRAGTSFPFAAPGGGLIEVPHALMDTYMTGDAQPGEAVLDAARRSGGMACLNWHERAFCEADFPGRTDAYLGLLRRARREGAWIAPVGDAAAWWRARRGPA